MRARSIAGRLSKFLRLLAFSSSAAIAAGLLYEQIGERLDQRNLHQVGRSFDIGGRSLNLYCSGTGSPTVIFESTGGLTGYRWLKIQREVADLTRACWYDRAGMGWSDPGPFPNHSDSVAHDLHDLLKAAHVLPPYVLVGEAMGAFHVRVFQAYYPAEVKGMLLVDPMNEDMTIGIHNHNEMFRPTVLVVLRIVSALGLPRLLQHEPGLPHGWKPFEWNTFVALSRQPKTRVAAAQELPFRVNGELARAASHADDIPMIVLSAGIQDQEEDPKLDHDHAWKLTLHEHLAHQSSQGRHVVVPNSGHDITDESPEAVIGALRDVLTLTKTPDLARDSAK